MPAGRWQKLVDEAVYGSVVGIAEAERISKSYVRCGSLIAADNARPFGCVMRAPAGSVVLYRWGWGFSTSQDFNGDIALIACFASSWTPAMVRRWHADPFGFLRPWNELPALMATAPPATPPSTGTGVVTFLMG
jgi:hypothetical protein